MTVRYICLPCEGENCLRCGGRGWVGEVLVRIERQNSLIEAVAKHLVQKRITQGEWTRLAAEANLTTAQFTEVEIWSASGPVKYEFMSMTDEVIHTLADLVGIEMPPVVDQPKSVRRCQYGTRRFFADRCPRRVGVFG